MDLTAHKEMVARMPLCATIRVRDLYLLPNESTFIVCDWDHACNIKAPSEWRLYRDDEYVCDIRLDGLVMGANHGQDIITFSVGKHLDKTLFDFNRRMELRRVEQQ